MKGQRITFSGQVQNYLNTVSQVVQILGDENSAADYLRQCIYSVGLGSNDYLNNYFMPQFYSTSRQFTPEQYADDLINRYRDQLNVRFFNFSDFQLDETAGCNKSSASSFFILYPRHGRTHLMI